MTRPPTVRVLNIAQEIQIYIQIQIQIYTHILICSHCSDAGVTTLPWISISRSRSISSSAHTALMPPCRGHNIALEIQATLPFPPSTVKPMMMGERGEMRKSGTRGEGRDCTSGDLWQAGSGGGGGAFLSLH